MKTTEIRAVVVLTLLGDGLTVSQVASMVNNWLATNNSVYVGGYNTKTELVRVAIVPEAKPAK
jgi:hypothetical protein